MTTLNKWYKNKYRTRIYFHNVGQGLFGLEYSNHWENPHIDVWKNHDETFWEYTGISTWPRGLAEFTDIYKDLIRFVFDNEELIK